MQKLQITDGTTRINLLGLSDGYDVDGWRQAIAGYKGGGVWSQSSLSEGRRLVAKTHGNVNDTFPIPASAHGTQDAAARALQDLVLLCEKASDYWAVEWQKEPVWLEVETECDAGIRYAVLYTAQIPELDDIYSPTFMRQAVMRDLTLVVERDQWLDLEPMTSTAVSHGVLYAFDGRNLGNVDSAGVREPKTTDEVYIRNSHIPSNLTDIYKWDQTGGAWDPLNYMDVAPPYTLFSNPAIGDIIYFGSDTTVANGGWFNSLVFDIGTIQTNDMDIRWEYCTNPVGPAFSTLPVQDNTNANGWAPGGVPFGDAFDTLGVNSVHWDSPGALGLWEPCLIGPGAGITGYWVRARIIAWSAVGINPQQRNRDIYSISWPYADIFTDQTGGQLSSRLQIKLTGQSTSRLDNIGSNRTIDGQINRVICGLRSYDRGANFTAYLVCNELTQQWPGISFRGSAAGVTAPLDLDSPIGISLQWISAGISAWATRLSWSFDHTVAPAFYGRYHAYLRGYHAAGVAQSIRVRLATRFGPGDDYTVVTNPVAFAGVGANYTQQLLDMGEITIAPPNVVTTNDLAISCKIGVEAECTDAGGGTVRFYDLVLIPVDEWAVDTEDYGLNSYTTTVPYSYNSSINWQCYLDIDSITNPKAMIRSLLWFGNDEIVNVWQTRPNGPAMLQTSGRQRLWFLFAANDSSISGADIWHSPYHLSTTVLINRVKRYLGLRGD